MLAYKFDKTTKLYVEPVMLEPDVITHSDLAKQPAKPSYTLPSCCTYLDPSSFYKPKWNGTKWVEGGDPVVVTALKKEAAFSTNNQKTLEKIAVLESQQTPRLLRGATLADPWSVTKLKSIESKITALRKTLV